MVMSIAQSMISHKLPAKSMLVIDIVFNHEHAEIIKLVYGYSQNHD